MEALALDVPTLVRGLHETFASGRTLPERWRRAQLQALQGLVVREEDALLAALKTDLGKCAVEGYAGEIGFLKGEIQHTLKHLRSWLKPEKVRTPLLNFKACSRIQREPLGVSLIIGPWNYPVQLLLGPLIGAIAAGNCALLKPSELTPTVSSLMAELVPKHLDPEAIRVVEGGVPETSAVLKERFDHVFFTGSTRVGKIVLKAAAEHLTPCTLELGGKSPCLVDSELDLEVSARRIVWGKFFNAGQTCVAPDYVLVHERMHAPLLEALERTIKEFYGEDPRQSPDLARIVSPTHLERLVRLMGGGKVVVGGEHDAEARYMAPTVLSEVDLESELMQEEIFGPLLPVIPVKDLDEGIEFVRARPKPLALYAFTSNAQRARRILDRTSSGGACVNDTLSHLSVPDLPFGGVGPSGMGAYHGKHSFEVFSHRKSVMDRSTAVDIRLRYPPYAGALKWIKRLQG